MSSWAKILEVIFGWADTGFGLTKEQRKVKIKSEISKLEREDNELRKKGKTPKRLKRRVYIADRLGTLYLRLRNLE